MVPKALDQNCSDRSANVEEVPMRTVVAKDDEKGRLGPIQAWRDCVGSMVGGTVPGGQTPGRR